jgi:hypothetical protein
MKNIFIALILLCSSAAFAAEDYKLGTYWTVTGVDTKPGHFDDYVSDLSNVWRKSLEMLKGDGKVVSYRMFSNVNGRENEPDLWLLVEWSSAAAMLDTPQEYFEAQNEELFGSLEKGQKANIKRGDIRTIMSNVLMQEVSFK